MKKHQFLTLIQLLFLTLTILNQVQGQSYVFYNQAEFDSMMTELGNDPDRYSWTSLNIDGYDDVIRNTGDLTKISVISDLIQIKKLTIYFGRSPFNQVEFDKVMDALQNYTNLTEIYLFFYAPTGTGSSQITNINKLKPILENNLNLTRVRLHFGSNDLDDSTCSNLLPIKNLVKLNYELSIWMWGNQISDISCFSQILPPLITLKRLTLAFEENPFQIFPLQESFKDLTKLTTLDLYVSSIPGQSNLFQNYYIRSDYITNFKLQLRENTYDQASCDKFFFYMPNLVSVTFLVRHSGYNYSDLKFFTDQLKHNPKVINYYFQAYYQTTSYDQIDLSEWGNLLDEIRPQIQYFYFYQYQFYYTLDHSQWTNILRDTPKLWKFYYRHLYNLSNNTVSIGQIDHPNITHIYYVLERVPKIIDNWEQLSNLYTGLPNLKYNHFQCSYCGLNNNNSVGFNNLFKSLVGRTFTDTFYISLYKNSFTDVNFLVNPHGLIDFRGYIYFNLQYSQLTNLDNMGPVLRSLADTNYNLFYMYLEYNKLTDISGLATTFNTYKMVSIYLELEYNQITNLGQLNGIFENQGGTGTRFDRFRIYTYSNPIENQSQLNQVLLPITYYGKSIVNTYMFQLKDPSYPTTNSHGSLKTNGLYPAIHDNGYCFSSYSQAKYYFETTTIVEEVEKIVKNCGDCFNTKCHSCSNNTACDKCRYSVPARILNKSCDCPDGYYDGDNYTCLNCMKICATCNNGSNCLTCASSNPARTTNMCICPNQYFDDGTNIQCQNCITGCNKCNNKTTCQECIDGYFLNSSNICVKCPNKFAKCTSGTVGTECQGTNRSTNLPNCECNSTFYDDNTNANCNSCVNNCHTCTSSSICQTCVSRHYLNGASCVLCPNKFSECSTATIGQSCQGANRSNSIPDCLCNPGYFDDGTNKADCTICQSPCKTCKDTNAKCLSCVDGYYLSGNSCVKCPNKYAKCSNPTTGLECQGNNRSSILPACPCTTGYYDDNTNANCNICVNNCHTCTSASVCQSCDNGYYLSGITCPQCPNRYLTCSDQNTGLQCKGANRSNNVPDCPCNSGYFDDGTNKADCTICQSPCKTCEDTNAKCLSCVDGYYLSGNSCIQCPNKYAKCSNPTTGLECLGNNRSSTLPACPCTTGYYDDNTNANCNICVNNCDTCTSASVCQSCDDGYYLSGTTCPQCPNRYLTCSDQNTGLQCKGANRSNNVPDCPCNSGYFDDGTNKTDCTICQSPCKTCEDTNAKCLSCVDGYYLSGNSCIQCPNKYAKCSNPTTGLECQGDNRSSTLPACPCNEGFFDDETNANCNVCQYPCVNCTKDKCLSCFDSINRHQNDECSCFTNFYDNSSNQACEKCFYRCDTCVTDYNVCETCSDSTRDDTQNCICKETYYDVVDQKECNSCIPPCINCTSDTVCQTCLYQGNSFRNNAPTCTCQDGYYEDASTKDCMKCPEKCSKCSDAETCTECNSAPGDERNHDVNDNCGCNDGFYDNQTNTLQCQICQYPCVHCISLEICVVGQCSTTENRNLTSINCQCSDGYYDNGQKCDKCDQQCLKCHQNADFSTGMVCAGGDTRDRYPQCICKQGLKEIGKPECGICANRCQECFGSQENCTSCVIGQGRMSIKEQCACKPGYFDDLVNADCQQCFSQCKTCSTANQCDTCFNDDLDPLKQCMESKIAGQASFSVTNPVTNQVENLVCDLQCSVCENQKNYCKECNVGINRQNNAPHCSCKPGYHDYNGISIDCKGQCDSSCLTCSNYNQCDSCDETKMWVMDVITMMCKCNKGYIQEIVNNAQKVCVPCQFYYKNVCVSQCPESTLLDQSSKTCMDIVYQEKNNLIYILSVGLVVITIKILMFFLLSLQNQSDSFNLNLSDNAIKPTKKSEINGSQIQQMGQSNSNSDKSSDNNEQQINYQKIQEQRKKRLSYIQSKKSRSRVSQNSQQIDSNSNNTKKSHFIE